MKYLPLLFILIAMPCWGQDDHYKHLNNSIVSISEHKFLWVLPFKNEIGMEGFKALCLPGTKIDLSHNPYVLGNGDVDFYCNGELVKFIYDENSGIWIFKIHFTSSDDSDRP